MQIRIFSSNIIYFILKTSRDIAQVFYKTPNKKILA